MKIKTLTADSVVELDAMINEWLEHDAEILGDMSTFRYKRQHAVHGYDIWETKFVQRIKVNE